MRKCWPELEKYVVSPKALMRRQHKWDGHVLRHGALLRRLSLHHGVKGGRPYAELKQEAKDRSSWRHDHHWWYIMYTFKIPQWVSRCLDIMFSVFNLLPTNFATIGNKMNCKGVGTGTVVFFFGGGGGLKLFATWVLNMNVIFRRPQ